MATAKHYEHPVYEATQAPTSAAAVANFFIERGVQDTDCPIVDQLKLQKLMFYAHGWYLANTHKPLFDEDIEAWPWGPVVKDVYNQTRSYGRTQITKKIKELAEDLCGGFAYAHPKPIENQDIKDFLEEMWQMHRQYTGIQLCNSTHAEGEPWTVIYELNNKDLSSRPNIPNHLIETVFISKLNDGQI